MRFEWLDRYRHPLACATSIILTSFGVYLVSRVPAPTAYQLAALDDEPLTIIWVERRTERLSERPSRLKNESKPPRGTGSSRHRSDALRTRSDNQLIVVQPSTDKAGPAQPSHTPLDLRLHEPVIVISAGADANIKRIPIEDFKRPSLLSVQIEDRSLGAFLSGASRGMECAELRAALHKQPASSNVIIESMRKRGCK